MIGLSPCQLIVKTVVVLAVLVTLVACVTPSSQKYGTYLDRKKDRLCRKLKCAFRRLNCRTWINRPEECTGIHQSIIAYECPFIECWNYGSDGPALTIMADCADIAPTRGEGYVVKEADNCALDEFCFVEIPPTTTTISTEATTTSTTSTMTSSDTNFTTDATSSGSTGDPTGTTNIDGATSLGTTSTGGPATSTAGGTTAGTTPTTMSTTTTPFVD